ncbi:MAG: alpha/beta fold hydrolase [Rhodoferax sp.]|nr:alpha/beta fold hydrolase [Rhodoferax sp.]
MALTLASDITGNGSPLLILHGLFGSATNWRSMARKLADRHAVHALDLRNHGASPWADTMTYTEMADDVRHYIEQHDLGAVTVMGHSMGGKTAMALALAFPDRVERLVVVDIAPRSYHDSLSSYAQAMRGIDLMAAASRGEVQRQLQALLPDASVAPFLVQNLVPRDDHFDWRINLAAISASMLDLTGFPAELQERVFDKPTAAIAGALSDYVPGGDTQSFRPMFPRIEIEVIDGAAHWVHADKPQAFFEAVQRALAR